jgi:hypothetical protein
MQDWTSESDRRLALVATINLSYSRCLLHTTYHVSCSPHDLVHQHGKRKNYGTAPMMPQGMKKALQSMRYLQTTKHKTQGKYQVLELTPLAPLIKGTHFQKIHLSSKCCECQILNNGCVFLFFQQCNSSCTMNSLPRQRKVNGSCYNLIRSLCPVAIRTPNTCITLREQKKLSFQGWRNYWRVTRVG